MHFPGRIPISIHPFFWLIAALLGWMNSGNLIGTLLWILVILVSVVVHEFGHALTATFFGQHPRIDLIAFGGLTSYEGRNLKLWQQFLIVFNGPLFGFSLFLLATFILQTQIFTHELILYFFRVLRIVNLFWSIVNLFPVLPLDGGQLLRIIFEAVFGVKGVRIALFVGMILAAAVSLFFFVFQHFLIGAIFFLFAFQSFDSWRKSKLLSSSDRSDTNKQDLMKAEMALQTGKKEEAKKLFEEVRERSKEGLLFNAATQYLAFLVSEEGKTHDAYKMLLPIKKQLSEDAVCLLHRLAFSEKDFSLVAELSSSCYQTAPSQDIALKNARAFGALSQAKPAGGWLLTAYNHGKLDLEKVLTEEFFKSVREDPSFKSFVDKIVNQK